MTFTPGSEPWIALLARLEISLHQSQHAVLSRDLAQLQKATGEQAELLRNLDAIERQRKSWNNESTRSAVVDAAERVLHLGRVQAALLRRARQSLQTASHAMAGRQAGYIPLAGSGAIALLPAPPRPEES
jgi:flagellar biosynthesis/type III secretory pathway chaperone